MKLIRAALFAALALIAAAMIVFVVTRDVSAQSCITIAEDKAKAERAGLEYLGVRDVPWTESSSLVYYRAGLVTLMSRVIGGCVEPAAHPVGVYEAETGA